METGVSTVLLERNPHCVPGFSGYRPQLKFKIGKSYGQLMTELRSPELHSSPALTLRNIPERHASRIIPGYTGFIPKRKNYIACSFSKTCQRAFSDFYQETYTNIQRASISPSLAVNSTQRQSGVHWPKAPLTPVSDKMVSNKSLTNFTPIAKPYLLADGHPCKYYMSGFTGHVPESRFLIGKGYPIATNEALVQFGRQQGGGNCAPLPIHAIYPSRHKGVVPSFTGHIPGYKFMYGHTFGRLSKRALEKSATGRPLPQKSESRFE
ncbi:ciliary microtubule inner protein 2B [Syngnathoides biaculeatus]|uniref:ciliary microtubule inner protein 2B n=1 Tax=Syngnathoides biaculeatus TaxID=300417 RepID=UPI002ADD4855|nr:ciliary microtubule inner protein 2B [Syngnathoides biaculeatus]